VAELQKAQRIAFYSVLVNVGATLGKAGLAFLTGSTALWAESLHALVDPAASAVTWMGIRVARLKNKGFPWGLYKAENLAALFISLIVFGAAWEVL